MDLVLSAFLSWQLILFSLGVFFIVWIIRTIVEFFWKNATGNRLWEDLFLRLSPVIVGAILAKYATQYPYPTGPGESGRIIFGLVGGGISTLMYGATKSMVKGYISGIAASVLNITNNSVKPAPPAIDQPSQPQNPNTGQMGAGIHQ